MRAILIHDIADVRAALAGRADAPAPEHPPAVFLRSAPGAALFMGAGWWRALQDLADREFSPHAPLALVLDCADAVGRALEALDAGVRHIALDSSGLAPGVWDGVAALARAHGAQLHPPLPEGAGLDLRGRRDPAAACRDWLAGR